MKKSNHVTEDDVNFIEFAMNEPVCDFFNRNAILFGSPCLRPNATGRIKVSKHGAIEQYTLFSGDFAHPMGAFSYNHSHVTDVRCGRYCSIGARLRVLGERHPMEWVTTSNITYCFRADWNKPHFTRAHAELMSNRWRPLPPAAPEPHSDHPALGNDVWIGEDATLARGIVIGTGAVIGSCAVVTKDVEPYMIVAGNPAKPIRRRFADSVCDRLLASRWWDLHPDILFGGNVSEPERFLDALEAPSAFLSPCPARSFAWTDVLREVGV